MTFGDALELIKDGRKVGRTSWGGTAIKLILINNTMVICDDYSREWFPSQDDMFSSDWVMILKGDK